MTDIRKEKKFIYQEIYQSIRSDIDSGKLKPGERLDNENELKDRFHISRDTLRKALAKLEEEGYIERKKSAGTFVKKKKHDYSLTRLESFTEQMEMRGIVPSSEMISFNVLSAEEIPYMEMLRLSPEDKVYKIERIRKGDGDPIALEVSYIPCELCPEIYRHLDSTGSLYQIYEGVYHLKMGVGKLTLEAEKPSAKLKKALNMKEDDSVLRMNCLTYLEDGTPLYYVDGYYKGEAYYFSAILPR